jgi:hypothetical protein
VGLQVIVRVSDQIVSRTEALTRAAEQSLVFHRTDLLAGIASRLSTLPGPGPVVGKYYESVVQRRAGMIEAARAGLQPVIAEAPARIRPQALLTLARSHYDQGETREAAPLYCQAAQAARGVDPVTFIGAQKMLAVLAGIQGKHSAALELLENLWSVAQTVKATRPDEYLEYLNTLACCLAATGQPACARALIQRVCSSALVRFNPHWQESQQEIETAAAPTIVVVVPDLKPSRQRTASPRMAFAAWVLSKTVQTIKRRRQPERRLLRPTRIHRDMCERICARTPARAPTVLSGSLADSGTNSNQ